MYIVCSAPVFFYQMFILLFTTLFLYLLYSFFPPEIVRWDIHSSLEHKKKSREEYLALEHQESGGIQ